MTKTRALAVLPLLALIALLATACVGTESPQGWAAPVFDGDTVYFMTSKDHLAAATLSADGASAQITWNFPDKNNAADKDFKLQAVYGEPVIDGDRIYFTSFSGGAFALDKATGRPIWQMKNELSGNIAGGLAVSGNFVAFGTTDGHVYVVNKTDKSPAPGWPASGRTFGDGVWATPVIKGDIMYIATMGGDLYAVRLSDGSDVWHEPFHSTGAFADLALLTDTTLFVPSLNHHVYYVNTADGTEIHDFSAEDWVWTQPEIDPGRNQVYFGDFSGRTYALDITSAAEVWNTSVGSDRVKSAPAFVDNVLVVADRKPEIHFLDLANNGKELSSVPLSGDGTIRADATEHDGFVYIATTNGKLLRADPKVRNVVEVTVGGRQ